ncbi:MAG: hypothetical protein ACSHX7_08520 [Luteolibacter sp.]
MSRRPLARRCFVGRSLVFRPSLSGSILRHVVQVFSRFLRRENPPAARSPDPAGSPRPTGQSLRSLRSIPLSGSSAPGLGLASAPAWG